MSRCRKLNKRSLSVCLSMYKKSSFFCRKYYYTLDHRGGITLQFPLLYCCVWMPSCEQVLEREIYVDGIYIKWKRKNVLKRRKAGNQAKDNAARNDTEIATTSFEIKAALLVHFCVKPTLASLDNFESCSFAVNGAIPF